MLEQQNGNFIVKEFDVIDSFVASKVSLDVYGKPSVCMVKDTITGLEFICSPVDIQGDKVTFVPIEVLNDTGLLEFGKGKWLYDLGFRIREIIHYILYKVIYLLYLH